MGPGCLAAAMVALTVSVQSAGDRIVILGMARIIAISSTLQCVAPRLPTESPAVSPTSLMPSFISHVHPHLICAARRGERGISGGEDVKTFLGHAPGDADHVLLRNPDIVKALRILCAEPLEA